MGTGAFTSVQAERSVAVDVANDANAFLMLAPEDTPNGNQYATQNSSGVVELDFSETDNDGSGLNRDADTIIRNVLKLKNQGTQEVIVSVTGLPDGMSIYTDDSDLDWIQSKSYDGSTINGDGADGDEDWLPRVKAGETMNNIGVIFRGKNDDLSNLENFSGTITFNAYTADEV